MSKTMTQSSMYQRRPPKPTITADLREDNKKIRSSRRDKRHGSLRGSRWKWRLSSRARYPPATGAM